jgi:hypothetical protein
MRRIWLAMGLLLVSGSWLGAQEILGAITGTVKDASGAAVPGAAVKAVNTATNLAVTEKTDAAGLFLPRWTDL